MALTLCLYRIEAWILNSNKHVLTTIHDNYLGNGVSEIPENVLLRGRPYGGVGILWKKTLANNVNFKTISNTERACAVEIKYDEKVLLMLTCPMTLIVKLMLLMNS